MTGETLASDRITIGLAQLAPLWLDRKGTLGKEIYAHYMAQIESGHLDVLREAAIWEPIAVYIGCIERTADREGYSLYCSAVEIHD